MPRKPRKPAEELTTPEVLKRVFPKAVRDRLNAELEALEPKAEKRGVPKSR